MTTDHVQKGIEHDTDKIDSVAEIELTLRTAVVVRSLSSLIGCKSWLVAALVYGEVSKRIDELREMIAKGRK